MNILDTRDLAKRLEELQDERESFVGAIEDAESAIIDNELQDDELDQELTDARQALTDWDNDNKEESEELENLESEISEWRYGATLIDDSDFVEYCQGLCEDIIGDVPGGFPGYIVIDWEATADNLEADYTTVTYQGTDYLVLFL